MWGVKELNGVRGVKTTPFTLASFSNKKIPLCSFRPLRIVNKNQSLKIKRAWIGFQFMLFSFLKDALLNPY